MKSIFIKLSVVIAACSAQGMSRAADETMEKAIGRGVEFLLSKQAGDGHFSDANTPALTALPLWAFVESGKTGDGKDREESLSASCEKAAKFVLRSQNEDGGFYARRQPRPNPSNPSIPQSVNPSIRQSVNSPIRQSTNPNGSGGPGGLSTYNTAVCLSALFEYGKTPAEPLLKARRFLADSQLDGDDSMAGGFGYGPARGPRRYADLSNTAYALDAMRRTEGLEEFRKGEKVDLDWDKAVAFVDRLQSKEGPDKGGAAYNQRTPQAGMTTNSSGRVKLMAYGSMSYAAVMSMAHARLSRGDPRVRNALSYCEKYWTLDENPGMGSQGLYYYYDILTRALSAAQIDRVGEHEWKRELVRKLVALQKPDGSWSNENNRFWEGDPVLCTSFAVIALSLCR